jgi:hypothetical protein
MLGRMASERSGPTATRSSTETVALLKFDPQVPAEVAPGTSVVVLDTTWTPAATERSDARILSLRDVAERVMTERDHFAESSELLDAWADEAGVIEAFMIDDVSFWYGERLRYCLWLVDQMLWLAIVDEVVASERPAAIECASGTDPALVAAARGIAQRDAIPFKGPEEPTTTAPPAAETVARADAERRAPSPGPIVGRIRRVLSRVRRKQRDAVARTRERWSHEERMRREVIRRIERAGRGRKRPLLVVQAHARQRIDTANGHRFLNPYLGPVMETLEGTALDPVEIDIRSALDDPATWERIGSRKARRRLPTDALTLAGPQPKAGPARERAKALSESLRALQTPLMVAGVDLGPELATTIARRARSSFAKSIVEVDRIRHFLQQVKPAGLLIADEYHRQDWLAAADAEGVPTAAIQHGVIYRWHNGYMYSSRPPSLRLPDRTYVYGEWERDLLTTQSVYRDDEVKVGGSPRLDLVQQGEVDREAIRRELGVADGDRMVVLSGTWGQRYRRFHYAIALAHLFCRPIDRVHLVVKLHPSERDEGPYREIIEGLASAGGFAAPPVTIVQSIDLYRLLAAADAHLGIHSTVLTEAVSTGTPNLLADVLAASDLLGYVAAGAAYPVRTPEDVAAALDLPRDSGSAAAGRLAFLRAHFEPGSASDRISRDLLDWLT